MVLRIRHIKDPRNMLANLFLAQITKFDLFLTFHTKLLPTVFGGKEPVNSRNYNLIYERQKTLSKLFIIINLF